MKKLALGALFIGLAAACGGGKVNLLDAGPDAPTVCNPIAQTGCMATEMCTWIVDIDGTATSEEIGHIGCSAAGTVADGAACADAKAGTNAGADICVRGDLCISGKCKPICDPQLVDGAAPGACALNYACSTYAGVFVSTGDPVAGVCEPGCDPLTQALSVGTTGTAACGSVDPAKPSGTCVSSRGFRSFHCAPTGTTATGMSLYTFTDRVPPYADSHGNIYGNGCAPGFIPFYIMDVDAGSMTVVCSGMCAPLKMDSTIAADPAHKDDAKGDIKALGKLPNDPAPLAGHATCDVNVKGSIAADPVTGKGIEDCRFVWFPLAQGDPTKAVQSPYNDTLGMCFAYQKYLTVTMPGTTQKFPEESCAELPMGDVAPTDPYGSAKENGCYPLKDSLGARKRPRSATFRLANGDGLSLRHVFD
jgi:hypothetical protein